MIVVVHMYEAGECAACLFILVWPVLYLYSLWLAQSQQISVKVAVMAAPKAPAGSWNMMSSTKKLAESGGLTSLPPKFIFSTDNSPISTSAADDDNSSLSVPIIDFSLLTSTNHDERNRAVRELGRACEEWGVFMVVNHGVAERDMREMMGACEEFFNLSDEEKKEFEGKHVLDPIRCGSSFNVLVDKVLFWRDFLKVLVHPVFHSPTKPPSLSATLFNYSQSVRGVARGLMRAVAESLGLEPDQVDKELGLESGLQIVAANYYPACPQPELAIGLPPHTDHGLLTLLIQDQVLGLQVQHRGGKWVDVNPLPNSFIVNTGDHMEIISNGKYKSVVHRALVNKEVTRMSIPLAFGPARDTVVRPLPELVTMDRPAAYREMRYADYLQMQQSSNLGAKSCLDHVRMPNS